MPEIWRLILDPLLDGRENMAVDEAILASSDSSPDFTPTLRLYGWRTPTISIGYNQRADGFAGFGLPVVRRVTGGRAVLHASEITYSITASVGHPFFSGGITAAYSAISECIMAALKDAGIVTEKAARSRRDEPSWSGQSPDKLVPERFNRGDIRGQACFSAPSRFELLVDGRKITGSAQRRFKNAFLQHGSILFSVDAGLNARVFGRGLLDAMTCVSAHSGTTESGMRDLLIKGFSEGLDASFLDARLSVAEEHIKAGIMESMGSALLGGERAMRRRCANGYGS